MKLAVFANKNFIDAFNELVSIDLPIKVAYKLAKIHKVLAEENERYEALKKDIILTHCEIDEETKNPMVDEQDNIIVKTEKRKLMDEKFNELLNIDFTIDTISFDELGDISLATKTLSVLMDELIVE